MKKFLLLISLLAKTSTVTGKDLDDLDWDDMLLLFADEDWVALFEAVYESF
jgi:hypothetical protein